MKPEIVQYDNRMDRTEIHRLLKRLPPAARVGLLRWACARAVLPGTTDLHPAVAASTYQLAARARWDSAADDRLSLDVYLSLWLLCVQYRFRLGPVLARLERLVRRAG